MKKKVQGRKGRPAIGKKRSFQCSEDDYARIMIACAVLREKVSAFTRDAVVSKADEVIKSHLDILSCLEFEDDELAKIAAEYLN